MAEMNASELLAAVDLGSNSFRLLIGRVRQSALGAQILPLDILRENVRLAAGLQSDGHLDAESQQRAILALNRFAERLRSFGPNRVRAVATNTFRVATNARHFLLGAEAALGFPIEVISGIEEARLIYEGAAHELPSDGERRLVVDIGGGSTECILGTDQQPERLESCYVGCVSWTRRYFPSGAVTRESIDEAVAHARSALGAVGVQFRARGWRYAVGTSGTAKALSHLAHQNFQREVLDRHALAELQRILVKAGHVERLDAKGLRADRRPVIAGGIAVMRAVFEEFGLENMRYCPAALREGVLYDLLGRGSGHDMRAITVDALQRRYGVDTVHADRVAETAMALFDQVARGVREELQSERTVLGWAARLGEVGFSIAQADYHKHSGYILLHAEMPGFSLSEKTRLANLALGQTGSIRKLQGLLQRERDWLMVLSLRIALILHRRRDNSEVLLPAFFARQREVRIELSAAWLARHPLSHASLRAEIDAWRAVRVFDSIALVAI
jgi:exopolyphosphatase/guanosine-5'-triphosphate,3'-diphosphate pyrophosphatase